MAKYAKAALVSGAIALMDQHRPKELRRDPAPHPIGQRGSYPERIAAAKAKRARKAARGW